FAPPPADDDPHPPEDAWRVWHIGPRLDYEVYLPIPGDARPWPQQIVDLFTARTGRPMVAPPWAFGPRRRINRSSIVAGVAEIQPMRDLALAIPAADDAVHFLPAGTDVGREAELADWTRRGAALGYRTMCYFNSLFAKGDTNPLRDQVATAVQNGWFL